MDKYHKLAMNSLIFAIGNLGSRFISIIMVPLYTRFMTTSEYGQVDLVTTAISLLLPIISLAIGQAVIRFAVAYSESDDRKRIFSNAVALNILGTLLLGLVFLILQPFHLFHGLLAYFTILLILQLFGDTISQFVRGIGRVRQYAINGILTTIITAGLNILLIVQWQQGVDGYLVSMIVAAAISDFYLFIVSRGFNLFSIRHLNKKLLGSMLIYAVPLIPNSIMWWIINGSTRYLILFFVGAGANGLFAVANKIPSILSIATNIFSQAWQLSAFEEQDSSDKAGFYTSVFKNYYTVLFIGASIILIITKPLIIYTVGQQFSSSWELVPFLLLASMYQSFSGFLGTTYTASLQTKGVFTTSILAAMVSFIANLVLLPIIGVYGAGIGTCLGFVAMWWIRLKDTKKIIGLNVNLKEYALLNIVFFIQTGIMYLFNNSTLVVAEALCFILMCLVVHQNLYSVIKKVLK
ncbi:lipopolysaccharide biosynthesis protein [Lactiplantibacillus plantarum]|uniref:lipopolysaccharide biosynthesis protein n=1 Tax=Lactiplantibacillus plantarum TaxID=1590 RepID=UPI001F4C44AA|nr:oligosaccharide flippase family protein [Lactiplantibacillus plantarum]UNB89111.1 oligosaccharide flippase family protein [Lactiplantibacillus plantarum]